MEPREVIKWLQVCSKNTTPEACKDCPYWPAYYEKGYVESCGKLLADAAELLQKAYPDEVKPCGWNLGPDGLAVIYENGDKKIIIPSGSSGEAAISETADR